MSSKQDKKLRRLTKKAIQQKTTQIAQSIFDNIGHLPIKARISIAMKIIFSPIKQKLVLKIKKLNPFKKKILDSGLQNS